MPTVAASVVVVAPVEQVQQQAGEQQEIREHAEDMRPVLGDETLKGSPFPYPELESGRGHRGTSATAVGTQRPPAPYSR